MANTREQNPEIIPPEDPEQFVDWTSNYIFWSFYFSQGDGGLQDEIDRFAISRLPSTFGKDVCEQLKPIRERVITRTSRFLNSGAHEGRDFGVTYQVNNRLDSVRQYWPNIKHVYSLDLIKSMIKREVMLLGARPGSKPGARAVESSARFGRSILLEHLVEGKDARHDVFRHLFQDAKKELVASPDIDIDFALRGLARRVAELRGTDAATT